MSAHYVSRPGETLPLSDLYLMKTVTLAPDKEMYFQSLRHEHPYCHFYLQTNNFYSRGPQISKLNGKMQMYIPEEAGIHERLCTLLSMCKAEAACPNGEWQVNFDNGTAWKDIDKVYATFAQEWQAFDFMRKPVECDKLDSGDYALLLQVTGVYMGSHGTSDKLASMQVKVIQVMYEAKSKFNECLFIPIPQPSTKQLLQSKSKKK